MPFDQRINYKVNLDTGDFQAQLSQLRASIDTTMGGFGGGGGLGGAYFGAAMGGGGGSASAQMNGMMAGLADFGAQVRPITYTPPAMAMQPNFGMVALQQTPGQAAMGAMGWPGIAAHSAMRFLRHPLSATSDVIPQQLSAAEYMTLSSRAFGTRLGDTVATAGLVGAGTAANLATSGIGAAVGAATIGGFLGSTIGGVLGGLPASMYMASVGTMMADNRSVQTQLEAGSFRFITGGKDVDQLTGRGFSRGARAGVADFIQTSEMKDLRYGMTEMKQILESGMQFDLFSGTKDADDFKGKFKGLVDTVKTITATLHTSLKQGMEAIRGFRDMGVTDPSQIMNMTMQAEGMGRMSGRTGMEMIAAGQTGAEMFRGTGVSMKLGFETNMQNVVSVRNMLNNGLISRDTVGQAGGENALAQQMTASALGATQTAIGRGTLLANYDANTGALRPNFGSAMNSGGVFGLLGRAAAMTPQQIMSFQAHEEDVVGGMSPMQLQLFGMQGDMMQAKLVTSAFSGKRHGTPAYQAAMEDNFIAMERRRGVPIEVIKANMGMLKQDPDVMKLDQSAAMQSMAEQSAMEDVRNRFNIGKKLQNVWESAVQPVQRGFTSISTGIGKAVDRATISLMGGTYVDHEVFGKMPGTLTGPVDATTAAELSKVHGVHQSTSADKEVASAFHLDKATAGMIGNLLGDMASFEDQGISTKAQSLGDVLLHDKGFRNLTPGQKNAVMSNVASEWGLRGVKKDITQNGDFASDSVAKNFSKAESLIKGARKTLGGYVGRIGDFNKDELGDVMSIMAGGAGSSDARLDLIKSLHARNLSDDAVHDVLSDITSAGKHGILNRPDVKQASKDLAEGNKRLQIASAQADKAGVALSGGSVGAISADTQSKILQMSEQFKSAMNDLIALQKQFNEAYAAGQRK